MRSFFLALAVTFLAAAPVPAHAITVDFTDSAHFSALDLSQTYAFGGGSLDVTLSSNGSLSFTSFDGDDTVAPLAFDNDGVGVGDDEITSGSEQVTVSFSKTVSVVGFHFLDLFVAQDKLSSEVAEVYRDGLLVASIAADLLFQQQGGYRFAALSPIMADMLVFKAASSNDGVGQADYALAALDVVPIPLPAALPLLTGALGVFGYLGWRRRKLARAAV